MVNDNVAVMLASACFGVGLLLMARAVWLRPQPLADRVRALNRPGCPISAPPREVASDQAGWQRLLGRVGVRLIDTTGTLDSDAVQDRLRVLGKPVERHAYEKLFLALVGFVLPNMLIAILVLAGSDTPAMYGLAGGVALGVAGFFYPDLPLAEQASERRQAFRHALSSYLDLVTIALAGGAGIESALRGAAEAGGGWAFAEIRNALTRAELTGITPWQSFDELGVTLGIDELRELASSVSLAGELGARVRQSLIAKADALRAQQAAAIEAEAESRTERMIGPVIMVFGLTMFIFYGALGAINPAPHVDAIDGQPNPPTATTPNP